MSKTNELTDEELVEIIRHKDQEMYAEIVLRYQDKLIRYASALIKNNDEASDVVQETFIKAFRNLNSFDHNKKFSSWIYRITHNEAVNYLKKQHYHLSISDHPWVEFLVKPSEDYADVFDRKLLENKFNKYLDNLPLVYREPIMLFYKEEKSYEEIAEILHIPTATVGTRIYRGRKILEHSRKHENDQS